MFRDSCYYKHPIKLIFGEWEWEYRILKDRV